MALGARARACAHTHHTHSHTHLMSTSPLSQGSFSFAELSFDPLPLSFQPTKQETIGRQTKARGLGHTSRAVTDATGHGPQPLLPELSPGMHPSQAAARVSLEGRAFAQVLVHSCKF